LIHVCLPTKQIKKRKPVDMDHNFISLQNQTVTIKKLGVFGNLFAEFKIGSLLNQSGIAKTKGASPLTVFTIIFNLYVCNICKSREEISK